MMAFQNIVNDWISRSTSATVEPVSVSAVFKNVDGEAVVALIRNHDL